MFYTSIWTLHRTPNQTKAHYIKNNIDLASQWLHFVCTSTQISCIDAPAWCWTSCGGRKVSQLRLLADELIASGWRRALMWWRSRWTLADAWRTVDDYYGDSVATGPTSSSGERWFRFTAEPLRPRYCGLHLAWFGTTRPSPLLLAIGAAERAVQFLCNQSQKLSLLLNIICVFCSRSWFSKEGL